MSTKAFFLTYVKGKTEVRKKLVLVHINFSLTGQGTLIVDNTRQKRRSGDKSVQFQFSSFDV